MSVRHCVLLATFLPGLASATAQQPDVLALDGEVHELHTNPLRVYLEANPDALPQAEVTSTALWRGYVATWEIDNGVLVLTKVTMPALGPNGELDGGTREVLSDVFAGNERVEATWYSGALIVPRGKLIDYVHMGYASTYEEYTVLVVTAGRVVSRQDLNFEQFIQYRWEKFVAFRETPLYREWFDRLTEGDDQMEPEVATDFLQSFYAELYLAQ